MQKIFIPGRVLIQEVFGSRVFGDYGMTEKVIHGGEYEHRYFYHLYPHSLNIFLSRT